MREVESIRAISMCFFEEEEELKKFIQIMQLEEEDARNKEFEFVREGVYRTFNEAMRLWIYRNRLYYNDASSSSSPSSPPSSVSSSPSNRGPHFYCGVFIPVAHLDDVVDILKDKYSRALKASNINQ